MLRILMTVAGATLALASGWGMVKTFRAGWFIARGGGRLQHSMHPVAFWLNAAGRWSRCSWASAS